MTIADMHYKFKQGFNALDTSTRRSFLSQEIDWLLNDAQYQFVLGIISKQAQGLVEGQRNLDELRTLILTEEIDVVDNRFSFPDNQLLKLRIEALASKEGCPNKWIRVYTESHDDLYNENPFAKSSFEWEELNGEYVNGGVLLSPTDFTVSRVRVTYIQTPPLMYYAVPPYRLPGGQLLSGVQDCILPESTHRQIVDLAVFFATADRDGSLSSRQTKLN